MMFSSVNDGICSIYDGMCSIMMAYAQYMIVCAQYMMAYAQYMIVCAKSKRDQRGRFDLAYGDAVSPKLMDHNL